MHGIFKLNQTNGRVPYRRQYPQGDNVPLWGNSTPKTKLIQWLCPRPGYQDESSNLRATAACERSSYGDAGPREFSNGESGQYRPVPAAR
jgi:hypothetical protein